MKLRFCLCMLMLGLSACGGSAPPAQAPASGPQATQEPPAAAATPQQRAQAVEAAMLEQQSKVDATLDAAEEPPAAIDGD